MEPPINLLCLLLISGLIGLAFYNTKKRLILSFAILWFFGNLVIESSVIDLDILFEHRTYLPSMFVCLVAVTFIFRYLKPKGFSLGLLCAVAITFSIWTYDRNEVWRNNLTLWADCAKKSPNKARPLTNLGVALWQRGKNEEAMQHYSKHCTSTLTS
jgi:hypothetical protein